MNVIFRDLSTSIHNKSDVPWLPVDTPSVSLHCSIDTICQSLPLVMDSDTKEVGKMVDCWLDGKDLCVSFTAHDSDIEARIRGDCSLCQFDDW